MVHKSKTEDKNQLADGTCQYENPPGNTESTCSKNTHHANLSLVIVQFLATIETTVNLGRNGANFCAQILLHHPQRMTIFIRDQVHRQTQVAETS